MGTTATGGSGTIFRPAPAGNHVAICTGVIDLGTQEKIWEGKSSWVPTIRIIYELADELREDGKPFTLSRDFTLSLHERSALRAFLQGWRGRAFTEEELKGFNVVKLLEVPCLLNVVHVPGKEGRTFASVTSATPLPKRIQAPQAQGDVIYYNTDDGPPPESIPEWIRRKILQAQEFREAAPQTVPPPTGTAAPPLTDDEDIPF